MAVSSLNSPDPWEPWFPAGRRSGFERADKESAMSSLLVRGGNLLLRFGEALTAAFLLLLIVLMALSGGFAIA